MSTQTEQETSVVVPRKAADIQRFKLEKLMKNPAKEVFIPEKSQEKEPKPPHEFIRNVWGSSAGAGSGDFHVYRGVRRREYARQKFLTEKFEKDTANKEYHKKLEENQKEAEEKTAKKRAKRQKKKQKLKGKKQKPEKSKETQEEESDNDEDDEDDHEETENKTDEDRKECDEDEKIALINRTELSVKKTDSNFQNSESADS